MPSRHTEGTMNLLAALTALVVWASPRRERIIA